MLFLQAGWVFFDDLLFLVSFVFTNDSFIKNVWRFFLYLVLFFWMHHIQSSTLIVHSYANGQKQNKKKQTFPSFFVSALQSNNLFMRWLAGMMHFHKNFFTPNDKMLLQMGNFSSCQVQNSSHFIVSFKNE